MAKIHENCLYIHKKTGNVYRVIGTAINSTNGECDHDTMVIYAAEGMIFVRKETEFNEKFYIAPCQDAEHYRK